MVEALLDHLGREQAVIGGTSLGANVGLEFASRHPKRVRGAVHRDACARQRARRGAVIFTPIMVGLQLGATTSEARWPHCDAPVPRTNFTSSTSRSTGSDATRLARPDGAAGPDARPHCADPARSVR